MMNVFVRHGFKINYTAGFATGLKVNSTRLVAISFDAASGVLAAHDIDHINLRGSVAEDRPAIVKIGKLGRYYLRLLRYLLTHRKGAVHFSGAFRNDRLLIECCVRSPIFPLLSKRYLYTAHNVLPHGKSGRASYRSVYQCKGMDHRWDNVCRELFAFYE